MDKYTQLKAKSNRAKVSSISGAISIAYCSHQYCKVFGRAVMTWDGRIAQGP